MSQGDLFAPHGGADPVARGRRERDKVLASFSDAFLDPKRASVVLALRHEALKVWRTTGRPVSVNDIRHVLAKEQYDGDPRILGAAFPRSHWKPVADTNTNSDKAHARRVRCFVPADVEWSTAA